MTDDGAGRDPGDPYPSTQEIVDRWRRHAHTREERLLMSLARCDDIDRPHPVRRWSTRLMDLYRVHRYRGR